MQSIKTPGSVWAKQIEITAANAKKPEGRADAFVYFVGARSSGKSTLLNRFLYPTRVEVPKPSEGLEYTYARKPSSFDHEKKDLAHIWEIGGAAPLVEEAARSDQLFLTIKQVTTAVVVLVVDLSDPASALPSLLTWLELTRKKLASTYEKFEKKGHQLPEQLRTRAKNKLFGSNEDKDVVAHTGVALVIAATKYDTLRDQDPEIKKVIGRTLRYIAHANGAYLMYLSGLHALGGPSSEASKDAVLERGLLDNFSRLLNHLVFTGLEKKPPFKLTPQTDHSGPLMVPAGSDRFRDIGRPRGAVDGSIQAGLQEWREVWEGMFPPKPQAAATRFVIDERYKEEEVDLVAARKAQEVDALRRELDQAKDAAKKKVATSTAAASPTAKPAKFAAKAGAVPDGREGAAPSAAAPTKKKAASSTSSSKPGTIKAG